MDDSDYSSYGGSSTAATLASVLAGGLAGYFDSQNNQPVTVTTPAPQTAYGYAGYGQYTPASSSATVISPTVLLLAALVVGVVIVLKKA